MLTAFQLPTADAFPHDVAKRLTEKGYACEERGYDLFVWDPQLRWELRNAVLVRGGCRLRRLAGGATGTVAVQPHWGIPGQELNPDQRVQIDQEIIARNRFSPLDRIGACLRLLQKVELPVLAQGDPRNLAQGGTVLTRRGTSPLASISHQTLSGGLLRPPVRKMLVIVSDVQSEPSLGTLKDRLEQAFVRASWGVEVLVVPFTKWQARLQTAKAGKAIEGVVFLVGISGGRGDPVPPATLAALADLDALRQPYRIFSDGAVQNRYAVNDMLPHLAELLGGATYRVALPENFKQALFIGLDLGHPLHQGDSVPVMSVVDGEGGLRAWWRGTQIRDETLRPRTLAAAAAWFHAWFNTSGLNPNRIIILRDGKMNRNDGLEAFRVAMPRPALLAEVIKSPVPLLLQGDQPAAAGTWVETVPNQDGFLQPPSAPFAGHLVQPFRLRIVTNPEQMPLAHLASALYTLCHAPTLGIRPASAATPIYWSDGLAQNGGQSIQFMGLHHVPGHDAIRAGISVP